MAAAAAVAVRRSSRLASSSPLQPVLPVKAKSTAAASSSGTRGRKAREEKAEMQTEYSGASGRKKRSPKGSEEVEQDVDGNSRMAAASGDVAVRKGKLLPSRSLEAELWQRGFKHVAGVDEAGRGPLAGPVVAAACVIPSDVMIPGINDSKKLTEKAREELYTEIISTPGVSYAVKIVDRATIDDINILEATMQAMAQCVEQLSFGKNGSLVPDYVLVDGPRLPAGLSTDKARPVVRGDAESYVIAAASILAKVTRDRLMDAYDKEWPVYGFKENKGYGTRAHIAAMRKHGPCEIHRRSFAPLRTEMLLESLDTAEST